MILRIIIVAFWTILTASVTWWAYQQGKVLAPPSQQIVPTELGAEKKTPGLPNGLGTPEDRYARLNWEKMRLANPTTGQVPNGIRQRELAFANKKFKTSGTSSTVWQRRGPFNVGGRTRALALDVDNENIIIAGGVTGGMWRSTDGGQSFTKTTTPSQLHSVTSVAQDTRPGKRNIWYHGTGEYYAIISASITQASGNGIYKSTDGGQSWALLPSTVSNTPTTLYARGDFDFVWDVVTDPTDLTNDVVFAAVINGIYRSKDGGSTWQPVLGADSTGGLSNYTTVKITPSGILYAVISSGSPSNGIWRSSDQGDTWARISPIGWPGASRSVLAITPQDENKVYALANTSSTGHVLWHYTYLSGDGTGAGGFWQNRTANLPNRTCEVFYDFDFGTYSSQSGYDMCLEVSPADSNLVILGGTNVYRSEVGWRISGAYDWVGGYRCDYDTPSDYVYPNHHPDQHSFIFLPSNPNKLLTSNDGGIYRTDNILQDSVRWTSLNNGYINSQFYTVAIEPGETNSFHMVGGMQDNGTYFTNNEDAATPWKSVFYGDGAYCAIDEGRNNYYLSWQTGKLFKFAIADDGTVNGLTRIDPVSGAGYLFINPFILDPADNNTLYMAGGSYLWRNNRLSDIVLDGEEYEEDTLGWYRIPESNVGFAFNNSVSALDISKSDNNRIYYGTTRGNLYRLDSLNGNTSQTPLTHSEFPTNGYVASIDVNENNVNEVLVSFSNYEVRSLFHSTDGGNTWTHVSGNLEENPDGSGDGPAVLWAEMMDLGDSIIYYAGTSTGLYATTNLNGSSTQWVQEGPNDIGNVVINMIQTRSHDGLVAVGSHGSGTFSTRYKTLVSVPEKEMAAIKLNCAPNPFTNSININYHLPATEKVSVTVFSLDGRVVKQLCNEQQPAGQQTLSWNALDNYGNTVAAGTYLVLKQSPSGKHTQKIMYTP